jgi:hypothetical protein
MSIIIKEEKEFDPNLINFIETSKYFIMKIILDGDNIYPNLLFYFEKTGGHSTFGKYLLSLTNDSYKELLKFSTVLYENNEISIKMEFKKNGMFPYYLKGVPREKFIDRINLINENYQKIIDKNTSAALEIYNF